MAQVTSGQVLRETRERKGYDIATVAHRLRIRTDILKAIESNDFNNMPSRGYTRNMISAYARLLGLNPTEIVNMYLDEAYANQVKRARSNPARGGLRTERERMTHTTRRSSLSPATTGSVYGDLENPFSDTESPRSPKRRLFDDRTQYSRNDYGIPGHDQNASSDYSQGSKRDYLSNHSNYASYYGDETDYSEDTRSADSKNARPRNQRSQRVHRVNSERRRQGQIYAGQTPMSYKAPRFGGIFSRLPLIAVIVVVVIIVAALIFFFVGRNDDQESSDVSALPVSGITDTTGTADDGEDDLTVDVAPTAARIVYSVAAGDSVYVEIYENGSEEPTMQLLEGPEEKTVETTGTWTITTYTPDLLNVTVNGEPVKLTASENYNGMSAYTVSFSQILQEWQRTHGSKQSQRSAALANATNAINDDAKAQNAQKNKNSNSSNTSGSSDSSDSTDTDSNDTDSSTN